ncbi:MAG TPA: hypothetical protein VNH18_14565, partial [Bryobacteraceae bacterium]|nr:hypothetical protein [Bryobacteraceae bacterium]
MNDDLIFQNLLSWSLQIAALTLTAAVVPALLRMAPAKARLVWLQSVLALCVLVPLIRPWKQEVIFMTPLA